MAKSKEKSTGSLIPAILKIESELHELDMQEKERAALIIREAEKRKEAILEETRVKIASLEHEGVETMQKALDAEAAAFEKDEEAAISRMKTVVENNRTATIDAILKQILPGEGE